MYYRKAVSVIAVAALALALAAVTFAHDSADSQRKNRNNDQVLVPLNLAILIQDDSISQVGNELGVTRDFIRSLPKGSQVMVGYITAGSLQVRQPFTTDLEKALSSLRIPVSNSSAAPYNPYVEVIEALRKFDTGVKNKNAVLLISDGLDTSRGFDITSAGDTLDIHRAITEANKRNVAIYAFYTPSVGLTSHSRLAASYGQSSLNRVANETGGKAFFQGTSGFVTFDSYFQRLRETLNGQYARAY